MDSKTNTFGPIRTRFERNRFGEGWMFTLQIGAGGKGAGYRWIDLPGYSKNVNHKFRRRLSISGRTFKVCHMAKMHPTGNRARVFRFGQIGHSRDRHRWAFTCLTTNGNVNVYPGWW